MSASVSSSGRGSLATDSDTTSISTADSNPLAGMRWSNVPPIPPRDIPRELRPRYPTQPPEPLASSLANSRGDIDRVYRTFQALFDSRADNWPDAWWSFSSAAATVVENPAIAESAAFAPTVTRADLQRMRELAARLTIVRNLGMPTPVTRATLMDLNDLAESLMDDVFDTSSDRAIVPHAFYMSFRRRPDRL